ncbi:penicillin-binding transpeptidase domain-containing protein [Actinoplanes sp. KI2]|uniref:penicillin-binding transpeptidase domain-containing protein n=1 Tax=Actinoplanes sp. KI2 TaxID=2983315 RepID=UPI0021D5C2FA|nr:penicillin-binding transpeptidase domain-containing protein [Actinoplanes sp. KI2]MCU7724653.1 penicillin-binding transpeptidase domain-containing protein [Actinoplanes sp. KI2]
MLDRRDLKRRRVTAVAASLTLVCGGLAACSKDGPDNTLKDFLTGWRSGNLGTVGFVTADGSKISATDVLAQLHTLSGDLAKQSLVLTAVGAPKTTGDISSSTIKLDWTLPGGVPWSYQSTVRLTKQGSKGWRVVWEPAIVQNELQTGDKLAVRRVTAKRATIQDATGRPIVTPRDVVVIGVSPQKITNVAQLQKDLAAAFKKINLTVDMSNLADRVKNSDPGAFIELVTLRRPDYDKIRNAVRPLAGTVFREETRNLAPSRAFARALLGTADEATREDIENNPDAVAQGDTVGHGGLQERYDATLRGTSGLSVVIAREAADGTVTNSQLYSTKPVDGQPIKISIDTKTQVAADAALATQKQPGSLVAIRVSDGSVLAVANGPDGSTVDTALTGQVPPGSTFKTVSAYGLLQQKRVTATSVVACPKTLTVDGREFKNSGGEVLGNVPFHVDYAKSCNTAFVGLSSKLGAAGLQTAAGDLGLGGQWDLGIDAFSGKVSAADSPTELAAATFGQGATAVSPVAMASVAAAVARGQFKQPRLVLDPAPTKAAADGAPLDAAAVGALRGMMREVVTGGTGTALRDVKGKPVFGKTGTAEFDDKSTDTHSWFIGYQGDVAFAVMVQKGGAGAEAAVPVVKNFLNALN